MSITITKYGNCIPKYKWNSRFTYMIMAPIAVRTAIAMRTVATTATATIMGTTMDTKTGVAEVLTVGAVVASAVVCLKRRDRIDVYQGTTWFLTLYPLVTNQYKSKTGQLVTCTYHFLLRLLQQTAPLLRPCSCHS